MNVVKRLPTLDEVNISSYKELYYKCLSLTTDICRIVPPHVLAAPDSVYAVFEFNISEAKDAYLLELENKLEVIKGHVDAARPKGDYASDMAEAQAVIRIISNNLERYL